jgi:predicted amidohydrolase YtcJ
MSLRPIYLVLLIATALGLITACSEHTTENITPADTIYSGGSILTMAGDQPEYVEALAVRDGKIVATGTTADVAQWQGHKTVAVDLQGKTLMPGFIDSHSHFFQTALKLSAVALDSPPAGPITSIDGVVTRMKERLQTNPPADNQWLIGWGLDNAQLKDKRFPTKHDLDRISTERPILIIHFSSHMLILNSVALERAGYTAKDYQDVTGGHSWRDKNGELTGVIEEQSMLIALQALNRDLLGRDPGMSISIQYPPEQMKALLLDAQELYLRKGFTTVGDMAVSPDMHQLFTEMANAKQFKVDLFSAIYHATSTPEAIAQFHSPDYKNNYRVAGAKLNLDGGSPGRTAYLRHPYHTPTPNQPEDYRGYPAIPDQSKINTIVSSLYQHDVPVFIHALGDAAVDQAISAVQYGEENNRERHDLRTQLIHLQVTNPDQLQALSELDVSLTFQTTHNFYFADFHNEMTLGPKRTQKLNATASAWDKGFSVTLHHDSPVHPVDQLSLVAIASQRKGRSGTVYGEEESLSVYQALQASTINAAYQFFEEEHKGSLEVGKLADMVILEQNPLQVSADEISDIAIAQTIKAGKVKWQR